MKIQDRTLFSFLRSEYERRVNDAVGIVYHMFEDRLKNILEASFNDRLALRGKYVPKFAKKLVIGKHIAKISLVNFEQGTSLEQYNNKDCLPNVEGLIPVLKDIRAFSPFVFGEDVSETPFFEENTEPFQYFCNLADTEQDEKHIQALIGKLGGKGKSYPRHWKKAKFGRVAEKLSKNPFYCCCVADAKERINLFTDITKALYSAGYPSLRYRELVEEETPDRDVLKEMNRRFEVKRQQEEIRAKVHRDSTSTIFTLEAYDGSFQNAGQYRQRLEYGIAFMKESLSEMAEPPLRKVTSGFKDFIDRNWGNLAVVNTLKSAENIDQASESIKELFEKHRIYNRNYENGIETNKKRITDDLIRLWNHLREREILKDKIEKEEEILRRKLPSVSYDIVVVTDKYGNILRYKLDKNSIKKH